ncbi:MAG: penicillin-binding protein [Propionibacterium sp.]|nr:penicillin-binding protein [Propionibacterium sp.]
MKKRIVVLLALVMTALVAGCTPSDARPPVWPTAQALAEAMSAGDLSEVTGPPGVDLQAEWDTIMSGMDGILPVVTPDTPTLSGDEQVATVPLSIEWPFESDHWGYPTTATFRLVEDTWQLQWAPASLHPQLTGGTRLVHQFLSADRANIIGRGSEPLVMSREVLEVGIDKQQLDGADAATSARALAELLEINVENYVARVEAAGPIAFVEALVVRGGSPAVLPPELSDIPGARAIPSERILAPSRTFAQGLLGTVAPVTAEDVEESGGRINPGDMAGASGLQARYDEQLRGLPGDRVVLVDRTPEESASPTPSGSPSAEPGTPSASPTEEAPAEQPRTWEELFRSQPEPGEPLHLTLDLNLQTKAEKLLADVKPSASIVVVDKNTGAILAAANSPADGANPNASFGRYAPGSTFKPVTALALVRKGYTANSTVECTATYTVDGRQFKNYADFPSGATGRTSLAGAMSTSCNTAFIAEHARISPEDLSRAAASLGLGEDYDAGFPVFYGSVPEPANQVGKAESLIGQGLVEASPVAMAGMVASIASGKTVIPYLVEGQQPTPSGDPLTSAEAAELQAMLKAVVDNGTGRSLRSVLLAGKTGTAEYGTDTPPKTHAWMVGWNQQVAIVVFVHDGKSGSGTAGPLVRAMLQ